MVRYKTAKAKVATPYLKGEYWIKRKKDAIICTDGVCRMYDGRLKFASKVVGDYDPREWLLSHVTIIASVKTQDGPDLSAKFNDYYLVPEYQHLINDNEDAWELELLMQSYPTFIGADNHLEHVQIPELARGKIIDAIPRIVRKDGLEILYVDILVATHKSHTELIEGIISGEVNAMSMGCFRDDVQISMADGFLKKISEVKPGDRVLTHTGRIHKVSGIQERSLRTDEDVYELEFTNSKTLTIVTGEHPYLIGRDEWKNTRDLKQGDVVLTPISIDEYQELRVTHIRKSNFEGNVYNFEVDGDNSYIADGVAVHNCSLTFSICTHCGRVIYEDEDMCEHVLDQRGEWFIGKDGVKRKNAELCGHREVPHSCRFTEASWVADPAFKGAYSRGVINVDTFQKASNSEFVPRAWESKEGVANLLSTAHQIAAKRLSLKNEAAHELQKAASRKLRVADIRQGRLTVEQYDGFPTDWLL